ncbi:MAG: TauD/TfdA family dioxygenase [Burkholderiales bacterium]|nr:TauD/TfdA family dioxygenase [Burkholderiales bacterium]
MQNAQNAAAATELIPQAIPSGKGCGAEVTGVNLAALDQATVATLKQAVLDHLVVVVRGQPVTDPQLIALGKTFGELEPPGTSVIGKPYIDEFPDILVISNIMEQGMPKGNLGSGEAIWHTDMSYREKPCTIAILHALEIPPAGGNTYFANQYMAYDALSDELKERLEGLVVIHDETYNSAGQLRKGFREITDPREAPGARHKIFRTHPATGRKALYLGRRRNAYIVGLPLDESERLLDQLWAHASRPEFVWHNEWKVGDTLIWDNRCLIHRRDAFDASQRRMMHRVQIRGEATR